VFHIAVEAIICSYYIPLPAQHSAVHMLLTPLLAAQGSLSHSETLESASVLITLGTDWPVCGLQQPISSPMLTLSVACLSYPAVPC